MGMENETIARALLKYRGDTIELLAGENVIGRGLDCRLRFNDATVSRQHVRILVARDGVTLEDLESRNGTKVNGARIAGRQPLADGDVINIGNRSLHVKLVTEDDSADMHEVTISDWAAVDRAQRDTIERAVIRPPGQGDMIFPRHQTCPACRAQVLVTEETCPRCGFKWPPGRPTSATREIPVIDERRRDPRVPVEIPVLYASESLTCDATASDLSRGGVFIITELLDKVDTPCRVTLLPDGGHAVSVAGHVRRVVAPGTVEGCPAGMGIEFNELTPDNEQWLFGMTQ
jgi:hypothetical protein